MTIPHQLTLHVPSPADDPVLITIMTEAFLNQQLGETFAAGAVSTPSHLPFQIRMIGLSLNIRPERRATVSADISVVAGPLKVRFRPVTEIEFLPQLGRVRIFVTKIQVQGLTIPRAWVDRFLSQIIADAEMKMNATLEQVQADVRIELFDLETTESTLVLKFRGL